MLKRILLIAYVLIIGIFVTFRYSNDRIKNNIVVEDNKIEVKKDSSYAESLDGIIAIPDVDIYAPVNVSTGLNDVYDVMNKSIAYDSDTGLPNEGKEIVLMGHREEELYKLSNIEKGDKIYYTMDGESASYTVSDYKVISASDVEEVYKPSEEEELRLFTCYPLRKYARIDGRFLLTAKKDEEV